MYVNKSWFLKNLAPLYSSSQILLQDLQKIQNGRSERPADLSIICHVSVPWCVSPIYCYSSAMIRLVSIRRAFGRFYFGLIPSCEVRKESYFFFSSIRTLCRWSLVCMNANRKSQKVFLFERLAFLVKFSTDDILKYFSFFFFFFLENSLRSSS